MSFTFFSAGNRVMDGAPFSPALDDMRTPEAAYARKKGIVVDYLIRWNYRREAGMGTHPTKDAYPDLEEVKRVQNRHPEVWDMLQRAAASDLALNGISAPAEPLVTADVPSIPEQRTPAAAEQITAQAA